MFLVAGVSGKTGAVVANELLARNAKIRVLVRDAAKGRRWAERGAEVGVADYADLAGLTRALRGVEGAYLLLPVDETGAVDVVAEQRARADAIARAVEASGVPHVVLLSSIAAHLAEGTGIISTLHYAEQRLSRIAGTKLSIIRASYFLDGWATVLDAAAAGSLPSFLPLDRPTPSVATADIGRVAAEALLAPAASGRSVVELRGPRDYTAREIAAALSRLLGRPVEPEAVPLEAVVPVLTGAGLSADVAEQCRQMYAAIANGGVVGEPGVRTIRGLVEPEAVFAALLAEPRA